MNSAAVERRIAPRFAVRCIGELASGSAVVHVRISNMSVTGCGIEMTEGLEAISGALGRTGVLNLRASETSMPVMLPVTISNQRNAEGRTLLGLQFRQLSMQQMRSLIVVLDGVIEK